MDPFEDLANAVNPQLNYNKVLNVEVFGVYLSRLLTSYVVHLIEIFG